jgi:hypothetical protein
MPMNTRVYNGSGLRRVKPYIQYGVELYIEGKSPIMELQAALSGHGLGLPFKVGGLSSGSVAN